MINFRLTFSCIILCVGLFSTGFCAPEQFHPVTSDLPPHTNDPLQITGNEITKLDALIEVTQQNLENQKKLRKLVSEYQQIQAQYLLNADDKEVLYRAVKSAHRLLENIKENHLTQAFDSQFISELSFFSQIATKRGIPKP